MSARSCSLAGQRPDRGDRVASEPAVPHRLAINELRVAALVVYVTDGPWAMKILDHLVLHEVGDLDEQLLAGHAHECHRGELTPIRDPDCAVFLDAESRRRRRQAGASANVRGNQFDRLAGELKPTVTHGLPIGHSRRSYAPPHMPPSMRAPADDRAWRACSHDSPRRDCDGVGSTSRHAQTTSGVWLLDGSPAVVVPLNATPEVLGDAVWKVAAPEARGIPHPSQQDWTRDGKERSTALFAQAGVRSWKSFERGSALASIERDGETAIVMPLVRDNDRPDAWSDDTQRATHLRAPDASTLGGAVIEALELSRS
jgi:hypothetical protein